MASDTTLVAETAPPPPPRTSVPSRLLGWAVVGVLVALLADVLLEGWVQQLAGHWTRTPKGSELWVVADWPKTVKTALYVGLAVLTVAKVAVDARWRDFLTRADVALAGLGAVLVLSGLVGGSHPSLIGQALFVYFRGVIVFYAWRALDPSPRTVRRVMLGLGAFLLLSAVIAIVQTVVGYPSYRWLGWTDLTWAKLNRAHALFNHPNNLGHVLMLGLLGLLAWFAVRERVGRRWWVLFGVFAFGLSATQSRESTIGFALGALVIWLLRRSARKTIAVAAAIVVVCAGLQLAVSPANRAVLTGRVLGLFNAVAHPDSAEPYCVQGDPACPEGEGVPRREIRVLFAQQGLRIWAQHPVLGLGVGQFGGIVAYKDNPHWADKLGFRLHGAKPDQVDSFWLHLFVEVGVLGVLAYLVWLYFLVAPMVRARERARCGRAFLLWGPAALVASVFIALLSPSLEDPLYPPLLFTVLGLGWVALRRPAAEPGRG